MFSIAYSCICILYDYTISPFVFLQDDMPEYKMPIHDNSEKGESYNNLIGEFMAMCNDCKDRYNIMCYCEQKGLVERKT